MTTTAPNSQRDQVTQEHQAIPRIIGRLRPHFPDRRADEVERAVYRAYAAFQHSRVRDFVPILVERAAREELQNL